MSRMNLYWFLLYFYGIFRNSPTKLFFLSYSFVCPIWISFKHNTISNQIMCWKQGHCSFSLKVMRNGQNQSCYPYGGDIIMNSTWQIQYNRWTEVERQASQHKFCQPGPQHKIKVQAREAESQLTVCQQLVNTHLLSPAWVPWQRPGPPPVVQQPPAAPGVWPATQHTHR